MTVDRETGDREWERACSDSSVAVSRYRCTDRDQTLPFAERCLIMSFCRSQAVRLNSTISFLRMPRRPARLSAASEVEHATAHATIRRRSKAGSFPHSRCADVGAANGMETLGLLRTAYPLHWVGRDNLDFDTMLESDREHGEHVGGRAVPMLLQRADAANGSS